MLEEAARRAEAPVPQEADRLIRSPDQIAVALRAFEQIGVQHIALQFMVPRWPERQEQIEVFAREVLPAFRGHPEPRV